MIFPVHYHCIMASEGMMCLFSQGQSTQTLTNHFRLREEGSGRRIFFLTIELLGCTFTLDQNHQNKRCEHLSFEEQCHPLLGLL